MLILNKSFNKYGNINKINALKLNEVSSNLISQRKRKLKKDKKINICWIIFLSNLFKLGIFKIIFSILINPIYNSIKITQRLNFYNL